MLWYGGLGGTFDSIAKQAAMQKSETRAGAAEALMHTRRAAVFLVQLDYNQTSVKLARDSLARSPFVPWLTGLFRW